MNNLFLIGTLSRPIISTEKKYLQTQSHQKYPHFYSIPLKTLNPHRFTRTTTNALTMTTHDNISTFFCGKTVFVTGATGFVGKSLIEKLLFSCYDLNRIYVLIRDKKGKQTAERIEEFCSEGVFQQRLKARRPDFKTKLTAISGDVSMEGLGLSESDRKLLNDEVSVIFHVAASINFEERLDKAVSVNLEGTKEIVKLARRCEHLEALVHVSTAFTHCPRRRIEEVFYSAPCKPQELVQLVRDTPEDGYAEVLRTLLGDWPNIYTFTKAVTEEFLRVDGGELPLCISRPAIVTCAATEPVPGWIDTVIGPAGIVVGVASGAVRIMRADAECTAELVPVDMVVNSLIASAFKTAHDFRRNDRETRIYNFVSSTRSPFRWNQYRSHLLKHGAATPTVISMWYCDIWLCKNKHVYSVFAVLMHMFPALFADFVCLCALKKPRFYKLYKKVSKFLDALLYFGMRSWTFTDDNVRALWEELSPEDRKEFPFDVAAINWDDLMRGLILSTRKFILKEDLSTVPKAKRKQFWLYVLHCVTRAVFWYFVLSVVVKVGFSLCELFYS